MVNELDVIGASEIADLLPKVGAGERLSSSSCLRLWNTHDLTTLGTLANLRREATHGNVTFFRPAIHVNYTRLPVPSCPLCSALARPGTSRFSIEELEHCLHGIGMDETGELHLSGGADPTFTVDDLCHLVRSARELRPNLQLRAFTWAELEQAAAISTDGPAETLSALMKAGLRALAGGTLAELTPATPHLVPSSIQEVERRGRWVEAAAALGLKCELSWVYGDSDDPDVVVESLVSIRTLQDNWGVFECCTPLLFDCQADEIEIPMATGYNQLRAIAVARLFLDNVRHIRGSWRALQESILQVAQWYGADDACSAILGSRQSLGEYPEQGLVLGREKLEQLLRAAGREPVVALGEQ